MAKRGDVLVLPDVSYSGMTWSGALNFVSKLRSNVAWLLGLCWLTFAWLRFVLFYTLQELFRRSCILQMWSVHLFFHHKPTGLYETVCMISFLSVSWQGSYAAYRMHGFLHDPVGFIVLNTNYQQSAHRTLTFLYRPEFDVKFARILLNLLTHLVFLAFLFLSMWVFF